MARIEQVVPGDRFMGLFSGSTGTGKTIAAASFPKPMYIFDFDGRIRPIPSFYPDVKGIEFDTYGVERQSPSVAIPYGIKGVVDYRDKMEGLVKQCDYATVIVDSLTSLCMTALNYFVDQKGRGKGKMLGGIQVPDIEDFGGESAIISDTLDILKILPCHIILTAHWIIVDTKNIKTQQTETTKQLMTGGKKIANVVPGYFDELYNFYVYKSPVGGGTQFVAKTIGDGVTPAKTALGLPEEIDFTDKSFHKLLIESIGKNRHTVTL